MSANFVQVSSTQGRTQTLTAGAPQTFAFFPTSLKGQLAGGDYIYASRIRINATIGVTSTGGAGVTPPWERLAKVFGQVRVWSPFLGEVVNRTMNSVPIIANHDNFFNNGYRAHTRKRSFLTLGTNGTGGLVYEFEIPFERDDMIRSSDSCPWLPLLEGGIIEVDLNSSTVLTGFTIGNVTLEVVIDWFPDKQALIHVPVANRLYKPVTLGPEYRLTGVGSPNGLDGVVSGCRLSKLSWLLHGKTALGDLTNPGDNGFYQAFGGAGGIAVGTNILQRMDLPWRDQTSINAVSAWISSFLADAAPVRMKDNIGTETASNDISGWPYAMDPSLTNTVQSLIDDSLDFWPLIWNERNGKISDMQKVDGDLTFTADLANPPGAPVLHLFRTEEVCSFSAAKAMDLMDRMGLPHKSRGGAFVYVPKYDELKRADPTTQWGLPLKIVVAS